MLAADARDVRRTPTQERLAPKRRGPKPGQSAADPKGTRSNGLVTNVLSVASFRSPAAAARGTTVPWKTCPRVRMRL